MSKDTATYKKHNVWRNSHISGEIRISVVKI